VVEVVDQQGEVVRTLPVTNAFGVGVMRWDGRTDDADFAEPGVYTFHIVGEEIDPSLYMFSEGTVDGVSTGNGQSAVRSGSRTIPLSAILDIATSPNQEVRV
jgi:flagellar hook assembly protein FlgD